MEETKEVKTAEETKRPEKMSYEQLELVAHQLSEQSRRLHMQLQEANNDNILNRLHYLFQVIKYKESFKSIFVDKCVKEIETIMNGPEESVKE